MLQSAVQYTYLNRPPGEFWNRVLSETDRSETQCPKRTANFKQTAERECPNRSLQDTVTRSLKQVALKQTRRVKQILKLLHARQTRFKAVLPPGKASNPPKAKGLNEAIADDRASPRTLICRYYIAVISG